MGRWSLVAVMLLAPLAGATQVLEDPEGDAQASIAGAAPADGIDTTHADLVGLDVIEEPEALHFALRVAGLEPDDASPAQRTTIHVDLQHRDVPHRIEYVRDTLDGTPRYDAWLMAFDPGRGDYVRLDRVALEVDVASATLTADVPRHWLLDGNGTAPSVGRELTQFKAYAQTRSSLSGGGYDAVRIRDAMPDQGHGDVAYPIQHGLAQQGTARLSSDTPVRASNGEKATFVFYVEAHNLAPDEHRFDLEALDVPDGWDVTLPAPEVRIQGNFSRTFPVLVAVPFQHQHGALEQFVLEMRSRQDPDSVGRVQLGIRYLAIPQPAGHHDRLHLHARQEPGASPLGAPALSNPQAVGYMNTLEQDDRAQETAVPPRESGTRCCSNSHTWHLYLEPGLQMGLDFDPERPGTLDVRFQAEHNTAAWALGGRLVHLEGEPGPDGGLRAVRETVLADITPTSPQAIGSGTSFEAVIQPTPASDLVPYTKHAALVLELELSSDDAPGLAVQQTEPMLAGGQLRLPLNEYRDPIQGVFRDLAGVRLLHDSAPERKVNPGETVLFNLTLRNTGALDEVFDLRVNGTNVQWARMLGDARVFVGAGHNRSVVVAVSPHADAPDGDIVDLIVTAASASDGTAQANLRVVALVDGLVDHPDESHLVQDAERALTKKQTPAAGWIVALPVVAAAALRRR